MRISLAILLGFTVMGCGDLNVNGDPQVTVDAASVEPPKPVPAPAAAEDEKKKPAWASADKAGEINACVEGATDKQNETPMAIGEAKPWCSCVVSAIESKYTYEELVANGDAIVNETRASGLMERCYEDVQAASPPPKLAKGMTKQEVEALFGGPDYIDTDYEARVHWVWDWKSLHCAEAYYDCEVIFDKAGRVVDQAYIGGEFIDLSSF